MAEKKSRNRPHPEAKRLTDAQLKTFDELFGPGFSQWYRSTHDEQGNLKIEARIQGLKPPTEDDEEDRPRD